MSFQSDGRSHGGARGGRVAGLIDEEEDLFCPLCVEKFDDTDKRFFPCPCGYQVCVWCYHNINEKLGGRCPACRSQYDQSKVTLSEPPTPTELSPSLFLHCSSTCPLLTGIVSLLVETLTFSTFCSSYKGLHVFFMARFVLSVAECLLRCFCSTALHDFFRDWHTAQETQILGSTEDYPPHNSQQQEKSVRQLESGSEWQIFLSVVTKRTCASSSGTWCMQLEFPSL